VPEIENKRVPMKYETKDPKELKAIELKYEDIDGRTDKVSFHVFEDGSDEQFLKLVKEFKNTVYTYDLWEKQHASQTVYKDIQRCLNGSARSLWDQEISQDLVNLEEPNEETFDNHVWKLTMAIIGEDAFDDQKEYLENTKKPEKLSAKQWINCLRNINSYLPFMKEGKDTYSKRDLIKIITKNIPSEWTMHFKMAELNKKTRIMDILTKLLIIEEQTKNRIERHTQS
jgi:hypothetical protein